MPKSTVKVVQKLKAQRLYVKRFLTAAQTARKVGVSENTLSQWVRSGNWRAEREAMAVKAVDKDGHPVISDVTVLDLLEFVRESAPHLANKLQPIINEYLSLK